MKRKIKKIVAFILNPRLILSFGTAWFITNGWSYVMLGVGTFFGINWMTAAAAGYLTFLWLPISPEKIVTFAIAIGLLRLFFPNDTATLAVLKRGSEHVMEKIRERKKKKRPDEKEKAAEDEFRDKNNQNF